MSALKSIRMISGLGLAAAIAMSGAAMGARSEAGQANIQHIMTHVVDPAADSLWSSVGMIETGKGTTYRSPHTAAEWAALRAQAARLIAATHALQARKVDVGGKTHGLLADADTPGTRTPDQIRSDIDRDPARFAAAAERLGAAGRPGIAAIRARGARRLALAGAAMDGACESCHAAYWYPRQRLALPSPDAFGRTARRP